MTDFIHFTLESIPISGNKAYRNRSQYDLGGRGRFKTREHRNWIELASAEIMIQRVKWTTKKISGPFAICVAWPYNARRDLDNYWKPFLDMLKRMDVIEDDRKCELQLGIKNPCRKVDVAMVVIRPVEDILLSTMKIFDSFTEHGVGLAPRPRGSDSAQSLKRK